jgi:hypothetical protein
MTQNDSQPPEEATDEIARRIADVIEDQEEQAAEHVDPHWEVFYDDAHDDADGMVHLHGDEKVPARVTANPDGSSVAACTKCDATLQISAPTGGGSTVAESAPVS